MVVWVVVVVWWCWVVVVVVFGGLPGRQRALEVMLERCVVPGDPHASA